MMRSNKASLSLVLFILSSLFAVRYAYADSIVVTRVEGSPVVVHNGITIGAFSGMNGHASDTIKTTADSSMDIAINGLAGCRVLGNSEVLIADANTESMSIKVISGNVILNLETLPANSTFRVETPTALASVRGTQFWGRVDGALTGNPVTTFAVRKGMVEVIAKGAEEKFTLEAGQALDIPKSAAKPFIRLALSSELSAMAQADAIAVGAAA